MTYAATVFSEAYPGVDCGRGTNLAFRVLGAPWLRAEEACHCLAEKKVPGVTFHPYRYAGGVAPYQGVDLDGIRLCVTDPAAFRPAWTSLVILDAFVALYGMKRVLRHEGARPEWFDKLYGTDATRKALQQHRVAGLRREWTSEMKAFLKEREGSLIYP